MTPALDDARQLLASALNTMPDAVPDSARIGELDAWDSLGHLRLILALEDRLGRELTPETIIEVESLNDVARLVSDAD